MPNEKELETLEQEERDTIDEELALMLLALDSALDSIKSKYLQVYAMYGTDGVLTYAEARKWVSDEDHTRRLTMLLLFIAETMDAAFITIKSHFEDMLKSIITMESDAFDVDLDIDKILNTKWGVDDGLWTDRLNAHRDKWSAVLGNDLTQSTLKRDQINDVIEMLNKRFMTMRNVLERLGYTEGTAVGSLARRRIFKELGVTKYRFYTRADERTCEYCGSLHGLVFPISAYEVGVTASPIHPRCRCWEIPIID